MLRFDTVTCSWPSPWWRCWSTRRAASTSASGSPSTPGVVWHVLTAAGASPPVVTRGPKLHPCDFVGPLPPRDAAGRFMKAPPPAPPPPPPGPSITVMVGLALFLLGRRAGRAGRKLEPGPGRRRRAGRERAASWPRPPPRPPPARPRAPALPRGKGMWLHRLEWAAGGDPAALVAHARAVGLTHLYLRLGSSKSGFYGQGDPRPAPARGPCRRPRRGGLGLPLPLRPPGRRRAGRGRDRLHHARRPPHRRLLGRHRDAAEGVNLTAEGAAAYGARLRELVGPGYPLIATVPPPPRWPTPSPRSPAPSTPWPRWSTG